MLGSLAAAGVERVQLAPLSVTAVRELAGPRPVDAAQLRRRSGGNPFFVTEVPAAGRELLPRSVRDAVIAGAAALDPDARALLEDLSVVTGPAPSELVAELGRTRAHHLGACLSSGMLVDTGGGVAFRHDLARVAIADAVDPLRRVALHRIALGVLRDGDHGAARLAHHADEAHDADALEEFAPRAAFEAVARGAHPEAVAQFRRALRPERRIVGAARADLLEQGAHELYLIDRFDEAIAWLQDAIARRHDAGDIRREANVWRLLSSVQRCGGRQPAAAESAYDAVALLANGDASNELAAAYANLAMIALNESAVEAGRRAVDQAFALFDDDADRAATARPRAGGAVGGAPTTRQNPAGLTAREVEVLRLVASGLQNHEIAAELVVSTRTVDPHVSAELRKLGVDSRRAAPGRPPSAASSADFRRRRGRGRRPASWRCRARTRAATAVLRPATTAPGRPPRAASASRARGRRRSAPRSHRGRR